MLASADASTIADVDAQRVMPTMLTGEAARYYRQRATAGEVDSVVRMAYDGSALSTDFLDTVLSFLDPAIGTHVDYPSCMNAHEAAIGVIGKQCGGCRR